MIENIVSENGDTYVSLSIDDMDIRKNFSVKGDILSGGIDLGVYNEPDWVDLGGGPSDVPTTHAMVMMITCLNKAWKVPCAYFLINDRFSALGNTRYIVYNSPEHCLPLPQVKFISQDIQCNINVNEHFSPIFKALSY